MRVAGARRPPAGWADLSGDIILRLTLMSVAFVVAAMIVEVISGLYLGLPILINPYALGAFLIIYFFGTGWLVILFATGSVLVERQARHVNNTPMIRRWQFVGFIAVAMSIFLPTAFEYAIKNFGAPEFFRIVGVIFYGGYFDPTDSISISLSLFLTLCALYGFSFLTQSREKKRTVSVVGAVSEGDAVNVNDPSEGRYVNHGPVPRNPSPLWRRIIFRLLLMNGFYLVASVATALFRWFDAGEPFSLEGLVLYSWFPWSVLTQGLLGYFCGILFAVGSVIVENRISNVKTPMIWRLRQLMGFAAVLIAIGLELVIKDDGPRSAQPGIVPVIVCALYGYSLFTQRRDAQRRAVREV